MRDIGGNAKLPRGLVTIQRGLLMCCVELVMQSMALLWRLCNCHDFTPQPTDGTFGFQPRQQVTQTTEWLNIHTEEPLCSAVAAGIASACHAWWANSRSVQMRACADLDVPRSTHTFARAIRGCQPALARVLSVHSVDADANSHRHLFSFFDKSSSRKPRGGYRPLNWRGPTAHSEQGDHFDLARRISSFQGGQDLHHRKPAYTELWRASSRYGRNARAGGYSNTKRHSTIATAAEKWTSANGELEGRRMPRAATSLITILLPDRSKLALCTTHMRNVNVGAPDRKSQGHRRLLLLAMKGLGHRHGARRLREIRVLKSMSKTTLTRTGLRAWI